MPQRAEKEQLRTQSRLQLLEMYVTAGMEIIGQVVNDPYDINSINTQLTTLYQFTQTSNQKISKAYGCTALRLTMSIQARPIQFGQ